MQPNGFAPAKSRKNQLSNRNAGMMTDNHYFPGEI